jgi:hypothetical protein
MKLVLQRPSPWPVHGVLDLPAEGTAIVLPAPIRAEPGQASWRDRTLHAGRPPFTRAEVVRTTPETSELGWPVELVETRLTDGKVVLEQRLTALYFVLEWWGAVIFRGADLERARPVLLGARPDWSDDGVVALAQLLSE